MWKRPNRLRHWQAYAIPRVSGDEAHLLAEESRERAQERAHARKRLETLGLDTEALRRRCEALGRRARREDALLLELAQEGWPWWAQQAEVERAVRRIADEMRREEPDQRDSA